MSLTQTINSAAPVAPTLTWATPAPISFGTPLSATQLDAVATSVTGATVPGTYVYSPAAGTILPAGMQTLSVTFTPADLTSFTTATQMVVLTVLQGTPTTTLTVTVGGSAATTVAAGTAVTLSASVTSAAGAVSPGQVNFCDATAPYCTDVHLLGTAQLTAAGTATVHVVPGIGARSYKAVFLGTGNNAGSVSAPAALVVTGKFPTTTTIAQSGSAGNYSLTATTQGIGSLLLPPTGTVSFLDTSNGNMALASAALGGATSAIQQAAANSPATGTEPTFVAVGDLNGDGKLDLAIANHGLPGGPSGGSVSILLGNGDGTFTAAASPGTGNGAYAVAIADFNGDGKADLAVTNSADNTVSVLLGNGDGTFSAAATVAAGTTPYGIAAGDFNGDGNVDLAVANSGSGSLTILLGHGDGTFAASSANPSTGTGPQTVVTADFNGDGKLDLAVANTGTSGVTILLGNGNGTFTPKSNDDSAGVAGGGFATVAVGDFNGDGKPDLVIASQAGNDLLQGAVLIGNGDGTFTSATGLNPDPTYSFSLGVRDFDGDGKSDIVLADDQQTTILLSNGDGTFSFAATIPTGTTTADYLSLAVGDFNGDGVPDTATSNSDLSAVSVLLTQLTETATASVNGVSPSGANTHLVVANYAGDSNYGASVSGPASLMGSQTAPTLTWTPAVASISYGTPLGAQQLNAVATGLNGATVAGTFTYAPAAGAVLGVGTQTLTVTFTSSDPLYLNASGTATVTVTAATPTLTWMPTVASIVYGTPLGVQELDATATGAGGAAIAGTLTYAPAAGAVLGAGPQTLSGDVYAREYELSERLGDGEDHGHAGYAELELGDAGEHCVWDSTGRGTAGCDGGGRDRSGAAGNVHLYAGVGHGADAGYAGAERQLCPNGRGRLHACERQRETSGGGRHPDFVYTECRHHRRREQDDHADGRGVCQLVRGAGQRDAGGDDAGEPDHLDRGDPGFVLRECGDARDLGG